MDKNITYKPYRLIEDDSFYKTEVKLVSEFNKFTDIDMSRFVYGANERGNPNDLLDYDGVKISVSLIQWLGTPVGKAFLEKCGFEYKGVI
jgi:hypothetical protein